MNPTDLQTILSTVLRDQEQRFTQLFETLRVANGVTQATLPEQRNAPPPVTGHRSIRGGHRKSYTFRGLVETF